MKATTNPTIDRAIETQLAYFKAFYYWVRKENAAVPMSEEYLKAVKMRIMIQDYKNYDGITLKSLVRTELEKLDETNEDEYERIVSMFGSVKELVHTIVSEARASEIIMKKFESRKEYEAWHYKTERQKYTEYEAQHHELDFMDLMIDHAEQWGFRCEEDVIVAAAMDGYDLSDGAPLSKNT